MLVREGKDYMNGSSKCQSPKMGVCLVCVKTSKEVHVVSMAYTVGKREKSRLRSVDPEG